MLKVSKILYVASHKLNSSRYFLKSCIDYIILTVYPIEKGNNTSINENENYENL